MLHPTMRVTKSYDFRVEICKGKSMCKRNRQKTENMHLIIFFAVVHSDIV